MKHSLSKSITPLNPNIEQISKTVVDAAFKVHCTLGPGLLENVYESCLVHELKKRGLIVERQVMIPVLYDDIRIDNGLKIDIVVEDCLIIELKAVEMLLPVHRAQLLTYLKLSGYHLGLLINFNVCLIKDGIKRIVL